MSAQPVPYQTAAVPIVRAWLALYTAGADAVARTRRRQQIESDLWEEHATASAEGVARWRVAAAVLGRMVRGAPSDLFWRLRLGGFAMEFNIRLERLMGLALVLLAICIPIGTAISGYDTGRADWSGELTRLGEVGGTTARFNIIFHVLAGIGLAVAGAALAVAVRDRAPMAGTIAGALLGVAGVLVLASSALYGATADMARDYVETGGGPSTLETTLALMLVIEALMMSTFVAAGIGVYTMAAVAASKRLVPRGLGWIAVASAAFVAVGLVAVPFSDELAWISFMAGAATMLVWLLIAGGVLVFGKHTIASAPAVTAPA